MNFLNFVRWFVSKEVKTHPSPAVVYKGAFKPVALLCVENAPDLVLKDHKGKTIATTNIHETPFKETVEGWSNTYSLVFPDSTSWGNFWMVYKSIL